MDDQPPRRRISDRDRRKWPDPALDQLSERVDASDDRFAAIDRRISEVRTDLAQSNERLARIEKTLNEGLAQNFREHRKVQQTADQIAQNVKPSRLDWAVKFATILSMLLVPFLTTYLIVTLSS